MTARRQSAEHGEIVYHVMEERRCVTACRQSILSMS